ncbi:MAG: HipA family kinase [Solirubrobacteraceae bacterium]
MERHRITRYVEPLREGGSLPGLVEVDDDGLYVVKLRGAGQGVRALVSEIVVGELARAVGLRVPDLALLELDDAIGRAEPDPEIQELLRASVGDNVGLDFLPASLPFAMHVDRVIPPEESAAVVWLDLLTTNVDRTPRNPNLLWWHGHLWLIDHGAALYRQHAATLDATQADRPFPQIADHVLLPLLGADSDARVASLRAAHARLAPLLTPELLAGIVDQVPVEWVGEHDYAAYLSARADVVGRLLDEGTVLEVTASATTGPGTGGLPRGPEARLGLGPRVGAPPTEDAPGADAAPGAGGDDAVDEDELRRRASGDGPVDHGYGA